MLSVLLCICIAGIVSGLVEKDAGKHEVYFQNVGFARDAQFYVTTQKKRVVILSEERTVSSLSTKTGSIAWRRILPFAPLMADYSPHGTIVLSENGHVYYFDTDGHLNWDASNLPSKFFDVSFIKLSVENGDEFTESDKNRENTSTMVAILLNNTVQIRSEKDGQVIFTYTPPEDTILHKVHQVTASAKLCVVGTQPVKLGSNFRSIFLADIDISNVKNSPDSVVNVHTWNEPIYHIDGATLKEKNLPFVFFKDLLVSLVTNNHFMVLPLKLKTYNPILVNFKELESVPSGIPSISSGSITKLENKVINTISPSPAFSTGGVFLVNFPNFPQSILFSLHEVNEKPKIQFISLLRAGDVISSSTPLQIPSTSSDDRVWTTGVAIIKKTSDSAGSELLLLDVTKGNSILNIKLPRWARYSNAWLPSKIWIHQTISNTHNSLTLLVIGTDGVLALYSINLLDVFESKGQPSISIRWRREEALAGVIQSDFIELPVDTSTLQVLHTLYLGPGSSFTDVPFAIIARIYNHALVAIEFLTVRVPRFLSYVIDTFQGNTKSEPKPAKKIPTEIPDGDQDISDSKNSTPVALTKDPFGYHKVLLLRTKRGKIFAIDNLNGNILWDKYFPISENGNYVIHSIVLSSKKKVAPQQLQQQDVDLVLATAVPTVSVIVREEGKWSVEILNALTGDSLGLYPKKGDGNGHRLSVSGSVNNILRLPRDLLYQKDNSAYTLSVLLIVDDSGIVKIFPEFSAESTSTINYVRYQNLLQSNKKPLYYFVHGKSTLKTSEKFSFQQRCRLSDGDVLCGYKIDLEQSPVTSTLVWRKEFPSKSEMIMEQIVSLSGGNQDPILNTYQAATPLPNGKVIWKYLNPNLLIVGTETVTQSEGNPSLRPEDYKISIHFIDIVTGQIIFSQEHPNCAAPLTMVNGENWLVYHFWNTKSHVYEIASIHLYQKNAGWNSENHTSTFVKYSNSDESDDTSGQTVIFSETQTWMFTGGRVSAMAVTSTTRGLANKQLLIALPDSNQVVAFDKRLLDPRCPILARQQQAQPSEIVMFYQQEGIPPYNPIMAVNTLRVINYNLPLAGIHTIATSATDVESRTDVLCHGGMSGLNGFNKESVSTSTSSQLLKTQYDESTGLDIFYLQRALSASKSYDILSDSFNEWLVIVSMAVLIAGSCISSYFASASALRNAWK